MKSVINEEPKSIYPCLKISRNDGSVVLFESQGCGTKIGGNGTQKIGYHSRNWAESSFELLVSSITLSN